MLLLIDAPRLPPMLPESQNDSAQNPVVFNITGLFL